MSQELHRTALIVGDYKESLAVVRSLGRAGYKVVVGKPASQRVSLALHSRYTSEVWEHPDLQREEQFIPALLAFLRSRRDVECVVPVGDAPVSCFARHDSALSEFPFFLIAPANAVLRCQDKIQMYETAVRLRIPTAPYVKVWHPAELRDAAERIGFPCVIKPRYSPNTFMAEKKAVVCKSAADVLELLPALPYDCPVVVQRFISGSRRTAYFIARHGRITAYFEHRPLRTDHKDGTGIAVESISVAPTPELLSYTARFVENMQYEGVGTSQFFFHEHTREVCFLEINPRFGATLALPYHCGFDIPLMAVRIGEGLVAPAGTRQDYTTEKQIHCLTGDLLATWRHIVHHGGSQRYKLTCVIEVLKSWWNADYHMTFEWSDPMPTLRFSAKVATEAASSHVAWVASALSQLIGLKN